VILKLKEVLGTQEFHEFTSLLKDAAPYQLKIDQANGCFEVLKKEEKQIFQQLQKKLKPYYDKLDKAWFS
jgi:hypothetical protein